MAAPQSVLTKCPYCREDIQFGAIKCKHCSEFLVKQAEAQRGPAKDGAAAVMSFFIPGLGQMYHGRIGAGLLWLFVVILGYALMVVPGLILHVICISLAYSEHKV
jgi:TM2 domain-containing membrane protein YozV